MSFFKVYKAGGSLRSEKPDPFAKENDGFDYSAQVWKKNNAFFLIKIKGECDASSSRQKKTHGKNEERKTGSTPSKSTNWTWWLVRATRNLLTKGFQELKDFSVFIESLAQRVWDPRQLPKRSQVFPRSNFPPVDFCSPNRPRFRPKRPSGRREADCRVGLQKCFALLFCPFRSNFASLRLFSLYFFCYAFIFVAIPSRKFYCQLLFDFLLEKNGFKIEYSKRILFIFTKAFLIAR